VKLQKRFNRKVGNKEYSKWVVVLPNTLVAEVGWKEGIELEADTNPKKNSLVLKPKKSIPNRT
jgi:bifunctional DNA-binding transcriptional regulator/antitoxin component of YhaV-PrlF toxin-antitoxin module